jgi:hypothetical protein
MDCTQTRNTTSGAGWLVEEVDIHETLGDRLLEAEVDTQEFKMHT